MVVQRMPEGTRADLQVLDEFKYWKPEAQERALQLLEQRKTTPYKPFYCSDPACDGQPHGDWAFNHARKDQRPPKWQDDWLTWVLAGGRGSGKTRTGSEVTHRVTKMVPRIILIAPTAYDLRETMVEGISGLQATANPANPVEWEPSKKKLTWKNGCIAQGFSAEEPDRLRGPQSGFIWADEPAHYDDTDAVWDNMMFGLRVGQFPKVVATSTPKPTTWMKKIVKDPLTILHRVSTYANISNLSPTYQRTVIEKYEGTRLGQQELHGEILEDVEGALWSWDMFHYVPVLPVVLKRIVVAVDPAGTANKRSDATGIIVLGLGTDNRIYVLADATGKYSPEGWATRMLKEVEEWNADAVVVEKTYGKDMVTYVLNNVIDQHDVTPRIISVDSRRGKAIRAEPIVALYEKDRIIHVGQRGDLASLEDEQTTWVPGEGASPNRVDALVHGATELGKLAMPASFANPTELLKNFHVPINRNLGGYR